jgi:ABC-type transport system involved in multi-copper enzyme maturation permease subunit
VTAPAPTGPVIQTPVPALGTAPSGGVSGFGRLLASEWTKIRSVRSTVWTLIAFVVVTIGFTALFAGLISANWNSGPNHLSRDATIAANPVNFIMGAGINLGQLTICVLGVLLITTEYSTGVIRASLLAVPRRWPMLTAKIVVFAVVMLVISEIIVFCSFFLGSALIHSHAPVSLSDSGVTRAVVGAGLYLTVLGLFALGIGGLIRHTAGAVSTVIGAVLVLPILSGLLPGSWGQHINAYLPEQAGSLIATHANSKAAQLLTPWEGFGVLCIWAALMLGGAYYLLARRDA